MFAFDLTFHPDLDRVPTDEFTAAVSIFLGALFRNGQAIGEWPVIVLRDGTVRCRLAVPAEDALDEASDGPWVVLDRAAVGRMSVRAFTADLVGRDVEAPEICGCPAPSARLLITTWVVPDPPVRCADCWGVVPLYRLPYAEGEKEHNGLLSWQNRWRAFDRLWLESGSGEGFAYAQMARPESPISREGRDLARTLERLTGVAVYYFLFQYHGPDLDACPGCGREWLWQDPVVDWIPHRCEFCRLVAQRGGSDEHTPDPGG